MTRDILDHQTEVLIDVLHASRRASHDAGDAKRASEKAIRIAQECQKSLEQSKKVADHLHLENAALSKRVRRLEARGSRRAHQSQEREAGGCPAWCVMSNICVGLPKRLGLDMDPTARRPADQQIILLNRETALGGVPDSSMMDGHQ